MMTKIFLSRTEFLFQIKILLLYIHVKIVESSSFFCLNCQIPDFSRFPGKVAIMKLEYKFLYEINL